MTKRVCINALEVVVKMVAVVFSAAAPPKKPNSSNFSRWLIDPEFKINILNFIRLFVFHVEGQAIRVKEIAFTPLVLRIH